MSNHNTPWCLIGDFNVIIVSHGHRGRHSPNRLHMEEFSNWSNQNNLIDITIKDSPYTWSNGILGSGLVETRLDKAFCNPLSLTSSTTFNVSTLNKHISNHHPLLLEISFSQQKHVSNFRFLGMWALHDNCETFIAKSWFVPVVGYQMYILTKKLQILKANLKV